MSTSINWTELVKDRKGIRTKDNKSCGNIIGNDEKNIIIEEGAMRQRIYRVPKSTIKRYKGDELTLNISYDEFQTDEVKDDDKDMLESIRSEEHTSELQSRLHLVCRLLLEQKN